MKVAPSPFLKRQLTKFAGQPSSQYKEGQGIPTGLLPYSWTMTCSECGPFVVRVVSGEDVRDLNLDWEEFGLSGIHSDFKQIPPDEIWVSERVPLGEFHFIMAGQMARLRAEKRGLSESRAYDIGIRKDKEERAKSKGRFAGSKESDSSPIIDKTGYIDIPGDGSESPIRVFLVDGGLIRSRNKVDFLEGGNGMVYGWIPRNQIWLESGLDPHELSVVGLHEFTERVAMLRLGLNYDHAHEIASKIEFTHRPDFSQQDLRNLRQDEILEQIKQVSGGKLPHGTGKKSFHNCQPPQYKTGDSVSLGTLPENFPDKRKAIGPKPPQVQGSYLQNEHPLEDKNTKGPNDGTQEQVRTDTARSAGRSATVSGTDGTGPDSRGDTRGDSGTGEGLLNESSKALSLTSTNELGDSVDEAAAYTDTNPTEEQKKVGNYRKGRFRWHGLEIVLENPRSSIRSGMGKDGQPWSVKMAHHYGYIRNVDRSEADNDHIDVFIGPNLDSDWVFIVNQLDENGKWDEHKCMLGFNTENEARKGYSDSYSPGWRGLGSVAAMTVEEFKEWLRNGNTKKPAHVTYTQPTPENHSLTDGFKTLYSGTCEPGQRADLTGCTPAIRRSVPTVNPSPFKQALRVKDAINSIRDAATQKLWDKLTPAQQQIATKVRNWIRQAEKVAMYGFRKTNVLAQRLAEERGLSPEKAKALAKGLAIVDMASSWTVNMPVTLAFTGSLEAAKVASWIPTASLAYIGYSTARNPFVLYRLAKTIVSRRHGSKDLSSGSWQEFLAECFANSEDPEWTLALIAASLEMVHTPIELMESVQEALKSHPVTDEQSEQVFTKSLDSQGGEIPTDLERAKAVDLITLPDGIPGTNCSNCRWIGKRGKGHFCEHPKVLMAVTNRNCCALWDGQGTKRAWQDGEKALSFTYCKSHSDPVTTLRQVCDGFDDIPGHGPDYQRLFWHPEKKIAWWEGFDGDENEAIREINRRLENVAGVEKVQIKAESSPPHDEGWILIWPKKKEWGRKSLDIQPPQVRESYFARCKRGGPEDPPEYRGRCLPEEGAVEKSEAPSSTKLNNTDVSRNSSTTEQPNNTDKASNRIHKIMEEVASYQFLDTVIDDGDVIDPSDYDEIEDRMTDREREEMDYTLTYIRDERIDEILRDFSPEIDEDTIINDLGYGHDFIRSKADDLVDEYVKDEDLAGVLHTEISDWQTHKIGADAVTSLWSLLRVTAGAPEKLLSELDDWSVEIGNEIQEALNEETERQEENERERLTENYDSYTDRAEYLQGFYRDNEDRFINSSTTDCGPYDWCKDSDGDAELWFNTSSGARYRITAVKTHYEFEGQRVEDIQFADEAGRFSITGKAGAAGALEVFTNVVPAVVAYVKHHDKDVVTFSADGPSRQRLYDRLVKTVLSVMPDYFAVSEMRKDTRYYVVGKTSLRDKIMEKVKHKALRNADEPTPIPLGNPIEVEPEIDPEWWDESSWEEEPSDTGRRKVNKVKPFESRRVSTTRQKSLRFKWRTKALSWLDETRGGALVPPPAQGKPISRYMGTLKAKAFIVQPSSLYGSKTIETERDKLGRRICWDTNGGKRIPCNVRSSPSTGPAPRSPVIKPSQRAKVPYRQPKEEIHYEAIPSKSWRPPPTPLGRKGSGPALRETGARSQTKIGDMIEELTGKIGLLSILPEGRRSNRNVLTEGSSFDREYDHSKIFCEIKGCRRTVTEYRAKFRSSELENKLRYAQMHGGKPTTFIAILDEEKEEIWFYSYPGLTRKSVPLGEDPRGWSYHGTFAYGQGRVDSKALTGYFTKSIEQGQNPVPPTVKESYFSRCERDELGHCLPEGQSSSTTPQQPSNETEAATSHPAEPEATTETSQQLPKQEEESTSTETTPKYPIPTPEQVFKDYGPRIYNLARRMVGNDADAEDVTQDVMLKVIQ
ncbi:MAG: hypothetical protein KGL39_00005, partial [Patescibacteria group bacterium]|nr:hypothetical protein [Patescibacteria group bacterium]